MRKSLCVGINAYPSPNELSGCVSDAMRWADYLRSRKFEVFLLLDGSATREAIITALESMVFDAKKGDVLAFVYSGHGTNVRDLNGDEGDGRDEAIVPVDFDKGHLIIDDDLRAIFDLLPNGVTLTCFLDSCYSGTATRLLGVNAPRMENLRNRKARYMRLALEQERLYEAVRAGPAMQRPVLSPESMKHATLSACTPQEVAYEVDGEGIFTKNAIDVMESSGYTLTLGGLLDRVVDRLGPERWQTPTLDSPEKMRRQTIVRKA